jgi:hypothetical protein
MKAPLLTIYGDIGFKYGDWVWLNILLTLIKNKTIETNGREGCYEITRESIIKHLAKVLGEIDSLELFQPYLIYPAHTDKGGRSFTIPISDDAEMHIANNYFDVKKGCLYAFDDGVPHYTDGAFLMIKLKADVICATSAPV